MPEEDDDDATLPGGPGDKRDPPPTPPPPAFLFAAVSLGLAGLVYIIKTICEWLMGSG